MHNTMVQKSEFSKMRDCSKEPLGMHNTMVQKSEFSKMRDCSGFLQITYLLCILMGLETLCETFMSLDRRQDC